MISHKKDQDMRVARHKNDKQVKYVDKIVLKMACAKYKILKSDWLPAVPVSTDGTV